MRLIGIMLALGYYLSIMTFCGNYIAKGIVWLKTEPSSMIDFRSEFSLKVIGNSLCDILMFRRLLKANDVLWLGEWVFHVSFLIVILRHLRYFLDPVPQWVWSLQPVGIIAGYVLPIAIAYIAIMKVCIEKKKYVSSGNFVLLGLIFVMSVAGLLMKDIYHPDIVGIKEFIMGVVTFRFIDSPRSALFIFHFISVLILIIKLPTHILAAPLTLMDARRREEYFKVLVHE